MTSPSTPSTLVPQLKWRGVILCIAVALSGCACNYPDVSPTSQRHWTLGTTTSSSRRPPGFDRPRQQRPKPADPASKLILDLYLNEPRGE